MQAADPSNECICDRQSHPSHDHVDLVYELPLPWNCAKCRHGNLLGDVVLESIFGLRQIAGLCSLDAEQSVPDSVRVFAAVSVQ